MTKRRHSADLKHLGLHVDLLHASSPSALLPRILESGSLIECFFRDVSDNAEEAVAHYEFFRQLAGPGTITMAHHCIDCRMSLLRPMVEEHRTCQLLKALDAPLSVGFVAYELVRGEM